MLTDFEKCQQILTDVKLPKLLLFFNRERYCERYKRWSLLRIAATTLIPQDYSAILCESFLARPEFRGSGFFVLLLLAALSTFAFAIAIALLGILSSPSGSCITYKSWRTNNSSSCFPDTLYIYVYIYIHVRSRLQCTWYSLYLKLCRLTVCLDEAADPWEKIQGDLSRASTCKRPMCAQGQVEACKGTCRQNRATWGLISWR